eukprot:403337805
MNQKYIINELVDARTQQKGQNVNIYDQLKLFKEQMKIIFNFIIEDIWDNFSDHHKDYPNQATKSKNLQNLSQHASSQCQNQVTSSNKASLKSQNDFSPSRLFQNLSSRVQTPSLQQCSQDSALRNITNSQNFCNNILQKFQNQQRTSHRNDNLTQNYFSQQKPQNSAYEIQKCSSPFVHKVQKHQEISKENQPQQVQQNSREYHPKQRKNSHDKCKQKTPQKLHTPLKSSINILENIHKKQLSILNDENIDNLALNIQKGSQYQSVISEQEQKFKQLKEKLEQQQISQRSRDQLLQISKSSFDMRKCDQIGVQQTGRIQNQLMQQNLLMQNSTVIIQDTQNNETVDSIQLKYGFKRKQSFSKLSARDKTNFFNNLVYSDISANKSKNVNQNHSVIGKEKRFDLDYQSQSQIQKQKVDRNSKSPNIKRGFSQYVPGPADYSPQYHNAYRSKN